MLDYAAGLRHNDGTETERSNDVIRVTAWEKPEAQVVGSSYGQGITHKQWCERVAAEMKAGGVDAIVSPPNLRDQIAVFRRK